MHKGKKSFQIHEEKQDNFSEGNARYIYLMFKKYPRVTEQGRVAALEKVMNRDEEVRERLC